MIPTIYLWLGLGGLLCLAVVFFIVYAACPDLFTHFYIPTRSAPYGATPDGKVYWIAKPSLLRFFMPKQGLAIGRCIHFGKGIDPSPWHCAHEWAHLQEQRLVGVRYWLWRYVTDAKWRRDAEDYADGYAWEHHTDPHFVKVASQLWRRRHHAFPSPIVVANWAAMRPAPAGAR